jgi:hypothetical protein
MKYLLCLRVTYGDFAALLLADIEGAGLRECVEICKPHELNANHLSPTTNN